MTDPSAPILWLVLILAAVWDVALRRIPNALVIIGLLVGAALQTQAGGLAGLGSAILGALVGLVLLIVPFAMRVMGGGDVKLTMVCGAFLGWVGVIELTLLSSIAHGMMAVCTMIYRRFMKNLGRETTFRGLPYAVSMVVGLLLYFYGVISLFEASS
ncbi:MAG: prepilin peptidase [Myxococcota bacterium]